MVVIEKSKSRRLSIVIGFYFSFFFLIFSFIGLIWAYITTNQLVGQQLSDTFDQKCAIAKNIIYHQEDLIISSLRTIKGNQYLSEQLSKGNPHTTQEVLIELQEATDEFSLDILFIAKLDNLIFADASSPFFNASLILPQIAEKQTSLLSKGEVIHLKKNGTDLTILTRAITLIRVKTGRVIGTLFGGVVINDNMSLLEKIRRETQSEAVLLLSDGEFLGSTKIRSSSTTKAMMDYYHFPDKGFLKGFKGLSHSSNGLFLRSRAVAVHGNPTVIEIVFAVPNKIMTDLRAAYLRKGMTLLLGTFAFLLLSVLVVRRFTLLPLKHLLKYSSKISEGMMDSTYQPGGVIEFNKLGAAMKKMVIGLKDVNITLQKDIAARRQTEKALRESEMFLRTLIETIPDPIWLKDPKGFYLTCNRRFEQLKGAEHKDIIGKTDYDFVSKALADLFRQDDKTVMVTQKPLVKEEEVTFVSDGHHEYLETIKTPLIGSDDALIGVLAIARNITDRKNAEKEKLSLESQLQQAHKMEAVGTLAGGIAHDFNNILAAILGYAEMALEDMNDDSPAGFKIEEVLKAGHRARDLVKHILLFSRKEAQERFPVNIQSLMEDALKLLRASIPTTIEIIKHIEPQCGNILAEPTQIHQVLMNLCTNAAQSMDENGGILEIRLTSIRMSADDLKNNPDLNTGRYLRLTIRDSGIGIEKKNIDRIFDPYFTTKEVGKGSGMGLAVVVGIVKSHDGMITVESLPGKGTTFQVYFPEILDSAQRIIEEISSLATGKESILVVDDEEMMANMTQKRLERLGYEVTAKTSSVEALQLFRSQKDAFDLIITDQTMPKLTGEMLSKKLMEIRPDISIIICTGYSSKIDAEKADFIGIKAFIMKPVDIKELAKTVRQVLDNRMPKVVNHSN